jgi:MurNAc alpha-1-phosphate uridylyltransferase
MTSTPRALILAAGRGERMRPLTDAVPKPLLPVRGRPLIEWHLQALAAAGVGEVVINTAWLGEQFPAALGDGSRWGLRIHYSHEGRDHGGALETAGGIATALPLLSPDGEQPFWLVSGDIHAPGFAFHDRAVDEFVQSGDLGLLWMVPNPDFHPRGDFAMGADGRLHRLAPADAHGLGPAARLESYTYANIALLRPAMVHSVVVGQRAALGPCLHRAADAGRLAGRLWNGPWENVGTPAQWQALQG